MLPEELTLQNEHNMDIDATALDLSQLQLLPKLGSISIEYITKPKLSLSPAQSVNWRPANRSRRCEPARGLSKQR